MESSTVFDALAEFTAGRPILVTRKNGDEIEGDVVCAAQHAHADWVNFMARHARGLICLALTEEQVQALDLPMMVSEGESAGLMGREPFTVSIEAKSGVSTGISASDRARTIEVAIAPGTQPEDISRPGHIFPLRCRRGGVLKRASAAEASIDLARMAGLGESGVLCKVMDTEGEVAGGEYLKAFCQEHGLLSLSIGEIIAHRMRTEQLVRQVARVRLPTPFGEFDACGYTSTVDGQTHMALVWGELSSRDAVLVRVHSECLTGDVFGSFRCDCGQQLNMALERIAQEGAGVLLYLRQEGRGIGLANKLLAYQLQDSGQDTVQANLALGFPPDFRDYGIGAQILADLGVHRVRVLTNNPKKIAGLELYGLTVEERVSLEVEPQPDNLRYLATKRAKLGHLLSRLDASSSKADSAS